MSWIDVMSHDAGTLVTEYRPAARADGYDLPPRVNVCLEGESTLTRLNLSIEHVRQLAEELPRLLMAHDAAEHVAKEQVAAQKAVAESKAA